MQGFVRKSDTLARFGGDEFVIFQTGVQMPEEAGRLARRAIDALASPFNLHGHEVVIGSSVGITIYPDDGGDLDNLLRNADLALYRSKAEGRGSYHFYEKEMNLQLQRRKTVEGALRQALAVGQFDVHYQPHMSMLGDQIRGAEALIRWQHPELGPISPHEFIPVAEETGLITPLTDWVLRRVCSDASDWEDLTVAVNLSPALFRQSNLVALVSEVLDDTGFDPQRLELEITESTIMADVGPAQWTQAPF